MATSAVLIPTQALSTPLTMTSIEIAEVTGKRHDNIVRDLRRLHEEGVIDLLRFEETIEIKGKDGLRTGTRAVYHLPTRETLILTSGYSAVQRAAVIDRLFLLEAQVGAPVAPAPAAPVLTKTLDLARYTELLEAENTQLRQRPLVVPPPTPVAPVAPVALPVKRRSVTPAESAQAVALFNAGRSKAAIARALGRSQRSVGRILERAMDVAAVTA